jgi:hypothetical protein
MFKIEIYTDNGGAPGALVAKSGSGTLVANSWNTISISAALSANTAYWLVYNTNATNATRNNMRYDTSASVLQAYSNSSVTFGTWPSNFGAATIGNWAFSIYATYH